MLWRDLRAWQIYGANTDVGKTILSTVLCKALARRAPNKGLLYLKPVSTGPQDEADDEHIKRHASGVVSKCISQFADPVSPHLAARNFSGSPRVLQRDGDILSKVKAVLKSHSDAGGRYALLETAGGVLSPGPSGTVQADLYRPLRMPVLLMGDSKLGGIGTTISAFESLHLRGYDVESVLLFDDPKWGNHEYLREHFTKHNIKTFALPQPPPRQDDLEDDRAALSAYYETTASGPAISQLISLLHQNHFTRISKLTSMSSHADSIIWHPFRQHQLPQNIIAIDSAYGDHFEAYNPETDAALSVPESSSSSGLTPLSSVRPQPPLLTSLFDASASWWTQGLGHGNPELSLTAAHAAGRYGHVMFASAIHEPALELAYNLLSTLQNPRLSRVFFTDNGSTGMEVAVKMALRATCQRYGWNKNDSERPIGVIGLKGSYHGDTIGVMNCSEPSTFNEKVDWYRPWGFWFEPPEVRMRQGQWQISLPASMSNVSSPDATPKSFDSVSSIFDFENRQSDAAFYESYIKHTIEDLTHAQRLRFGALIIEPVIMGAGGMIFVDPLFQRTLIKTIRSNPSLIAPDHDHSISHNNNDNDPTTWSGLPFIADEVFTGLYRLGRPSSTSFLSSPTSSSPATQPQQSAPLNLDVAPDISVHAKLLTGGLLPLALTTASPSIFSTFLSDSKTDALLHGHSYTAHPIGCSVANKSLAVMDKLYRDNTSVNTDKQDIEREETWTQYRRNWSTPSPSSTPEATPEAGAALTPNPKIWSFFSPETLTTLSHHPRVESCFALGTVLALTLRSSPSPSLSSSPLDSGIKSQSTSDTTSSSTSDPQQESTSGSGYTSTAATGLQQALLKSLDGDGDQTGVHSRVLGDVIYFMTGVRTLAGEVRRLEGNILRALDETETG